MVAAEAAAAGCPPLVARHSGLAEIAAGLEQAYPPEPRDLAAFESGDAADLAAKLREAARALAGRARGPRRGRAAGHGRALELGAASPSACSQP